MLWSRGKDLTNYSLCQIWVSVPYLCCLCNKSLLLLVTLCSFYWCHYWCYKCIVKHLIIPPSWINLTLFRYCIDHTFRFSDCLLITCDLFGQFTFCNFKLNVFHSRVHVIYSVHWLFKSQRLYKKPAPFYVLTCFWADICLWYSVSAS